MFANKQVEAVARILAVTILLDKRQRDREMVEFCYYVKTINQDLCSKTILPRQKIMDWFEAHKQEFATGLANDTDGSFKTNLLKPITDPNIRRKVLTAIFAISISDQEFHNEECSFIKTAINLWQVGMPSMTEVSEMAG